MTLVAGSVPSFIGGVSQQDSSVRQSAQIEEALNLVLSPAKGAGPRPPALFVAGLASDIPETAFFHSITRDAREKYIVVVYDQRVRVFNHVTGHEYVVVMDEASKAYLSTQYETWQSIRACTIEDYTILANREVVVAMGSAKVPGVISGRVNTFQDLPTSAPTGQIIEIHSAASGTDGRYYVQNAGPKLWTEVAQPGVPSALDAATMPHGLKRVPDSTNPDGLYFSYGPLDWEKRLAGDEASCPPPSFVGQRIGSVGFHHDRLVFLAGENVVMSEVGYYFNFWRTTVTALLDSDTIDVAAPTEGVAQLTHMVAYQSVLMLMASGKKSLFQLSGAPLTPKTVKIDPVTDYPASPLIPPCIIGSSMFFIDDSLTKQWAMVREYFVSSEVLTPEAANITSHVPHYVPGGTRCIAAVPYSDLLLLSHRSPTGPQVYVHQFHWAGDQKQQSAWHPWKLTGVGAVVHMQAIGSDVYLVAVAPGGGVELLRMDMSPAPSLPEVTDEFDIHLDRREVVTPQWTAFGNYTDLTVPFVIPSKESLVVLKTAAWGTPGAEMDLTDAVLVNGGQTLRIPGNKTTGPLVIGFRYLRRLVLSEQYMRDQNGSAKLIGRLQIKRMTIRFASAAFFRCLVYPKGRPEAIDTLVPQLVDSFNGRTAGDAAFLTNTPQVLDGTHKFLVASRSDQCRVGFDSDSPYPCWWQSAQWEGNYTTKVRM